MSPGAHTLFRRLPLQPHFLLLWVQLIAERSTITRADLPLGACCYPESERGAPARAALHYEPAFVLDHEQRSCHHSAKWARTRTRPVPPPPFPVARLPLLQAIPSPALLALLHSLCSSVSHATSRAPARYSASSSRTSFSFGSSSSPRSSSTTTARRRCFRVQVHRPHLIQISSAQNPTPLVLEQRFTASPPSCSIAISAGFGTSPARRLPALAVRRMWTCASPRRATCAPHGAP
ncbi:hypothetical protein B0H11DRAFT_2253775 [Mycena galericulata]|nr:hypothetical protein B0H11DRAFT_2253775 [Mycena galericulata]